MTIPCGDCGGSIDTLETWPDDRDRPICRACFLIREARTKDTTMKKTDADLFGAAAAVLETMDNLDLAAEEFLDLLLGDSIRGRLRGAIVRTEALQARPETIRGWLSNAEIPDAGRGIRGLDNYGEVEISKATWLCFWKNDGKGGLQVSCSGTAIVGFAPAQQPRRSLYLVVDDGLGKVWDGRMRRIADGKDKPGPGNLPAGPNGGPRPNAILRVVQSA